MKKQLFTTVALVSLFVGATVLPVSAARAAASTKTHTGHGPLEKLKTALAQLDLSAGQQTQINAILSDAKTKLASAKGTGSGGSTNKPLIRSVIKTVIEKVNTVLTAPQKTKLRELMKPGKSA